MSGAEPAVLARRTAVSAWPMWVLGFAGMIDNVDQFIARGVAPSLEMSRGNGGFGVGDVAIAVMFSAFILINGVVTLPAGYLGDRWSRTRAMAVTIVAWSVISAMGGLVPTTLFWMLVLLRGALGFGQAVTDPSGSSLLADYYVTDRRGAAFSVQQCLGYIGLGLGLAIGGALSGLFRGELSGGLGWRLAFGVSVIPGLVIAVLCWRLPEPRRGTADRAHVIGDAGMELSTERHFHLFPDGLGRFAVDMWRGLVADIRTILKIPTMRYALVGVSTVLFVVTAVATWMPTFYQRQLGMSQPAATAAFGGLAIAAGIPGTLIGGRIADRWVKRFLGARVVIPAICIIVASALFMLSFVVQSAPNSVVLGLQVLGFLAATASVPALRAGLSDSVPAHLRGTGFGAFNLASVVFGAAAAPLLTAWVADEFPSLVKQGTAGTAFQLAPPAVWSVAGNFGTAFLIVLPLGFVGAAFLLAARRHIERDTAKIFEAVVMAMAAEQAAEADK